jgi:hypothetical protein
MRSDGWCEWLKLLRGVLVGGWRVGMGELEVWLKWSRDEEKLFIMGPLDASRDGFEIKERELASGEEWGLGKGVLKRVVVLEIGKLV